MRGTTPIHYFELPISVDKIRNLSIVYKQGNRKVLRKERKDCTLENEQVILQLTQAETLKFSDNVDVDIQIRVLLEGAGNTLKSDVFSVSAGECLDDEVLE